MKVSVLTLGCKVNKCESEGVMQTFKENGFEVSENLEFADLYIINTCAVTGEAEKKSRQMVARCRKCNPDSKIYVCGCASQNNSEQFQLENVVYIKGVGGKSKIFKELINRGEFVEPIPCDFEKMPVFDKTKTRAYIKIQDGCNNFCSYCIIPYLRGRSRSRDFNEIVDEVKNLPESVKEIVLVGINLSDYKINNQKALIDVVEVLNEFGKRIRFGSLEEFIIDQNFVERLSKLENFCPHFHLSLQSGSDSVLKRMNRKYTIKEFKNSVNLIRKHFPLAGITTDVIVGFCSEIEREFEETYNFIEKIGFSSLHIFQFSKRKGTVAFNMKDTESSVKKQRATRLKLLNEKLVKKFINQNQKLTVLVEEFENGFAIGHSKNFLKAYVQNEKGLKVGDIVNVQIIKQFKDGVICEII